jgi:SulP family sulfate permease
VVAAIGVSWALNLGAHLETLGAVPSGLPTFGLPHVEWSWPLLQKLLPIAFACFVVILAQSAATSRAYAAKYSDRFDENVDMVGLGMANLGAGLSGTFIVNGSPTNTAMVDGGGGRSQVAQLTTCAPRAGGPAVSHRTAGASADRRSVRHRFSGGGEDDRCQGHAPDLRTEARAEFWVALLTAATVVVVGVEQGIIWPWCCRCSTMCGAVTGAATRVIAADKKRKDGRPFR